MTLKIREISDKVFEVSGNYDVAALIQVYNIEDLNRKVDAIRRSPFVIGTNTLISLARD